MKFSSLPNHALVRAIRAHDVPGVAKALAAGADPNSQAMHSMLTEAVQASDLTVLEMLLDAGADPSLPDRMGGRVPAAQAMLSRHAPALRRILERGGSTAGPCGGTILHMAATSPTTASVFVKIILECVPSLLDAKDDSGLTALHRAVEAGHLNLIADLLEAGANPNTVALRGETPLGTAIDKRNLQLCEMLISAGAIPGLDAQGVSVLAEASPELRAGVEALVLARQVVSAESGPRLRL